MNDRDKLDDAIEALKSVRRTLFATDTGLGPSAVRELLERVNEALGLPKEAGMLSGRVPLPMRCDGGKTDPAGGCWFCAATADKLGGARCPRRPN